MGSKNGKYNVEHGDSVQNGSETLSSMASISDESMVGEKSRKEEASLPTLIHQDSLADTSSSNTTDLTLVWLDTELNDRPSNIDTQIKLKNLINYLRIFEDLDTFEQYIEQIGKMNNTGRINEEKLFVIISPILALTIIPHFHDLPQVKYIYIYGKEKIDANVTQQLLKKYIKVYRKCLLEKFYS